MKNENKITVGQDQEGVTDGQGDWFFCIFEGEQCIVESRGWETREMAINKLFSIFFAVYNHDEFMGLYAEWQKNKGKVQPPASSVPTPQGVE